VLDRVGAESQNDFTSARSRAASARSCLASGCVIQSEPRAAVENSLYGRVDLPWVHPLPRITMLRYALIGRCSFSDRCNFGGLYPGSAIPRPAGAAFDARPTTRKPLGQVAAALARLSGVEPHQATGARIGSVDDFHVGLFPHERVRPNAAFSDQGHVVADDGQHAAVEGFTIR
jgi:hypothetical protein